MTTTTNTQNTSNTVERVHKGCTFIAYSEQQLNERIERFDYERSIFYKSGVYTYSCHARVLDDKTVEFIQFFNNGETKKVSNFNTVKEFWANLK
jgi:hypothetical protein